MRAVERRNVFAFSMSVAAHEVVQFAGIVSGLPAVGGHRPQRHSRFPGEMRTIDVAACEADCE